MQLTHVCVADAVQVVVVSSVRRIEEERTSCLHRGEHVELPLPSYLAHVCAERQSAPRVRFPDALEPVCKLGVCAGTTSASSVESQKRRSWS